MTAAVPAPPDRAAFGRLPARLPLLLAAALAAAGLGALAGEPPAGGFTDADYAREVARLEKLVEQKLPGKTFPAVVQPPFIVFGDEDPATVRQRARSIVQWAAGLLRRDLFRKDPAGITSVWLFRDGASYQANARALFGEGPATPYGYYSERHAALVMNIASGSGTLVHEMVHAFVRADFPDCPAWLNEGLGALYERPGETGGHIYGWPNWRLPTLKAAIRAGTVPSFKALTATTSDEFYGEARGLNYAQARYLCYYLQEQGQLFEFYRAFRENCAADPTGYGTLQKILGTKDLDAFQRKWEAFMMEVPGPGSPVTVPRDVWGSLAPWLSGGLLVLALALVVGALARRRPRARAGLKDNVRPPAAEPKRTRSEEPPK